MKKVKEPIIFNDYESLIKYIRDTVVIDAFILESVNEFIIEPELESVELDLECKEINKIMRIIYEREMIPDVLTTLLDRYISNEDYEKCVGVRDLINQINKLNENIRN